MAPRWRSGDQTILALDSQAYVRNPYRHRGNLRNFQKRVAVNLEINGARLAVTADLATERFAKSHYLGIEIHRLPIIFGIPM
jgi:hypothetical protein